MARLFSPAVSLLNSLRYPQKFALISLLFVLPLALVLFLFLRELNADIAFARKELVGTAYLQPLRGLFEDVPRAQLLTDQAARGDAAAKAALPSVHAKIEADFERLAVVERRHGEVLSTADRYGYLLATWGQLKREQQQLSRIASEAHYEQFIANVRDLVRHVGDQSNLILDPDLDSYYLMESTLRTLPDGQLLLAQMVLSGEHLEHGIATEFDRVRLFERILLLRANNAATMQALQTAQQYSTLPELSATLEPLKQRIASADSDFIAASRAVGGSTDMLGAQQQAAGAAALAARFAVWNETAEALDKVLKERIARLYRKQLNVGMVAVTALVLVLYLLIGFYRSVMHTVHHLEGAAQRLVNGDTTQLVALKNRDELAAVATSFNRIATAFLSSNAHREAVVEYAADGIVTLDEQGNITSCNPAAARIFGYSSAEIVGEPVARLMPQGLSETHNWDGTRHELIGQRSDGTEFPMEIAISETFINNERHAITIVRDITERKQAEAERERLQQAIIRAQAESLRELATPLIPVTERTVVMPLIGSIDSQRAAQIVTALLEGVERHRAIIAIIDITGVPIVDTHVAGTLIRAAQAAQLLGARVVITGMRPEVASTLVMLGVDLRNIATHSSLQSGIAFALTHENVQRGQRRSA